MKTKINDNISNLKFIKSLKYQLSKIEKNNIVFNIKETKEMSELLIAKDLTKETCQN